LNVLQLAWLVATFVGAACISLLLTPLIIRAASALKLYDAPDGVRRLHDSPVPRLGGVAVYLSAAIVTVIVILIGTRVFWMNGILADNESRILTGLLFGSAILFTVGLIDDIRPLPPSVKFAAQVVAALVAFYFGAQLNRATLGYGVGVRVGMLSAPLILLWIIGVTNAYNLIDGLNGLAGGIAIVACAGSLRKRIESRFSVRRII